MQNFKIVEVAVVMSIALSGCATNDRTLRNTAIGAGVGAAGGAVVGAVVPGVSTVEGAAIGALAGAVIGAVSSDGRRYYWDDRGDCFYVKDDRRMYVDRQYCRK